MKAIYLTYYTIKKQQTNHKKKKQCYGLLLGKAFDLTSLYFIRWFIFRQFQIYDSLKVDLKSVVSKQKCIDYVENDHLSCYCLNHDFFTDSNKTFSVTPTCIDVPPLKSCTFSVSFKPVSSFMYVLSVFPVTYPVLQTIWWFSFEFAELAIYHLGMSNNYLDFGKLSLF